MIRAQCVVFYVCVSLCLSVCMSRVLLGGPRMALEYQVSDNVLCGLRRRCHPLPKQQRRDDVAVGAICVCIRKRLRAGSEQQSEEMAGVQRSIIQTCWDAYRQKQAHTHSFGTVAANRTPSRWPPVKMTVWKGFFHQIYSTLQGTNRVSEYTCWVVDYIRF